MLGAIASISLLVGGSGTIVILLGVGAAWLTSGMTVEITFSAIGMSFLFSFAVGVFLATTRRAGRRV